jgi:hypothetical protein
MVGWWRGKARLSTTAQLGGFGGGKAARRAVADLAGVARNRASGISFTCGEAGEDEGATAKAMVVSRG